MSDEFKLKPKARRLWREREELEKRKDEDAFKIVEEVFDSTTLGFVYRLERRGVLANLKGVISAGKEARVHWGVSKSGEDLAVKIYLIETSDFKKSIKKYIVGDPRFENVPESNIRKLIYAWARKEFKNLKRLEEEGVRAPRAIDVEGNVLVMTFIGEKGVRAPLLAEAIGELDVEDVIDLWKQLVDQVRLMVCKAKLVHADLSEYNVMVWRGETWIIDVAQAVEISHPLARELLERDLKNLYRFFSEHVEVEERELREAVLTCLN
ncbi:MAG: serine protein kinase RIO [Acidilobaceae archaeon]